MKHKSIGKISNPTKSESFPVNQFEYANLKMWSLRKRRINPERKYN